MRLDTSGNGTEGTCLGLIKIGIAAEHYPVGDHTDNAVEHHGAGRAAGGEHNVGGAVCVGSPDVHSVFPRPYGRPHAVAPGPKLDGIARLEEPLHISEPCIFAFHIQEVKNEAGHIPDLAIFQVLTRCLYHTLVIRMRLERMTVCLEGRCSIQLSYRTLRRSMAFQVILFVQR